MGRKRFSPEQIIVKLREAEIIESKGLTQVEAAKKLGIAGRTRLNLEESWRTIKGGMAFACFTSKSRSVAPTPKCLAVCRT